MYFYFSGLKDQRDVAALRAQSVTHVLVDPVDLPRAVTFPHVVLDSGAYRRWKQNLPYPGRAAFLTLARSRPFDAVVADDVFGDAEASFQNWLALRAEHLDSPLWPVWPWGADRAYLHAYLDGAPVVGIGGLVPLLRNRQRGEFPTEATYREWRAKREQTLQELGELATDYPGRFHAFGLCWAKALDALWNILYSADTSHWLTPRRSGLALYVHTRTGYLQEAPYRALKHATVDTAVDASIQALLTFRPARWACHRCGIEDTHRRMRLLPAAKRRCACGGKIIPEV